MSEQPYQIEKTPDGFKCAPTMTPYVWMLEAELRSHGQHHNGLHTAVDLLNLMLAAGWRPPALDFVTVPRSAVDDLLDELDDASLDITSPEEGEPIAD